MLPNRIPTSSVVKNTVRDSLKGKWLSGIVAGLIPVFSYYVINLLISAVVSLSNDRAVNVAYLLLLSVKVLVWLPLFYGVLRWFWRLTDGAHEDISSAFYYFTSKQLYIRTIKLSCTLIFKTAVVFLLCMVPFFAVQAFSNIWLYDIFNNAMPVWAINITAFKNLFYTFGILLAIALSLRYYMTPIVAVMDDNLLILEAVHISTTLSKKSLSAFFNLVCSNIVWIALSVLALPLIYTAPFLIGCYVVHSRFVITNYNLNLEFYENNRFHSYYKV